MLLSVTVCCRTNTDDNEAEWGAGGPAGVVPPHLRRSARVEVLEPLWVDFCRELSPTLTGEARLRLRCCLDRCFCKENRRSPVSDRDGSSGKYLPMLNKEGGLRPLTNSGQSRRHLPFMTPKQNYGVPRAACTMGSDPDTSFGEATPPTDP